MKTDITAREIVILGRYGSGKTSLLDRFQGLPCPAERAPTTGIMPSRLVPVKHKESKTGRDIVIGVPVRDCSGAIKWDDLKQQALDGAKGVIVVLDLSIDPNEDKEYRKWLNQVTRMTVLANEGKFIMALLLNKADLVENPKPRFKSYLDELDWWENKAALSDPDPKIKAFLISLKEEHEDAAWNEYKAARTWILDRVEKIMGCFHESTIVTTEKGSFTLKQLQASQDWHVPHIVTSSGVRISFVDHDKDLRLTDEHLVFTENGLVFAKNLEVGTTVFTSLDSFSEAKVLSVVREEEPQRYFGLNGLDSVVLANGVQVSTFGVYHFVPSMWMKCAGRVLGVRRASEIGDTIAHWWFNQSFQFN